MFVFVVANHATFLESKVKSSTQVLKTNCDWIDSLQTEHAAEF